MKGVNRDLEVAHTSEETPASCVKVRPIGQIKPRKLKMDSFKIIIEIGLSCFARKIVVQF